MVCWSRSLLADIVRIKIEHYEMSKVRSQSAEEYLKAFFEAELKPIWPQGWIQTRFDTTVYTVNCFTHFEMNRCEQSLVCFELE